MAVRYAEITINMNDNLVVAHPTNEAATQTVLDSSLRWP